MGTATSVAPRQVAPREEELRAGRDRAWLPVFVALLSFLIFALLRSADYRGESLDYALAVERTPVSLFIRRFPGHVLFGPLCSVWYGFGAKAGLFTSALQAMVWLNVLASSVGVGLMAALAQRMIRSRAVVVLVTAGLAVSYVYWQEAGNATPYPTALTSLLAAAYLLMHGMGQAGSRKYAWYGAAGAAHGVAVLLHITMLLFWPAAVVGMLAAARRGAPRWRAAVVWYGLAFTATGLAPLLAVALTVGQAGSVPEAFSWLSSSSHGQRGELGVAGLVKAGYGLVHSLVFLGELGEASRAAISSHSWQSGLTLVRNYALTMACLAATGAMLGAALLLGVRRAPGLLGVRAMHTWWLSAWAAAFAVLGAWYFPSEIERWLVILPPLWLLTGLVIDGAPSMARDRYLLCAAVVFLALINGLLGVLPTRDLDRNPYYTTARNIDAHIGPNDLIVMAGRCPSGYLSYFLGHEHHLSLFWTWLGDKSLADLARHVREGVADAETRGGKAWLYGDFSTPRDQASPWTDFAQMGVSKEKVKAALSSAVIGDGIEVAPGEWLYRLQPAELSPTSSSIERSTAASSTGRGRARWRGSVSFTGGVESWVCGCRAVPCGRV